MGNGVFTAQDLLTAAGLAAATKFVVDLLKITAHRRWGREIQDGMTLLLALGVSAILVMLGFALNGVAFEPRKAGLLVFNSLVITVGAVIINEVDKKSRKEELSRDEDTKRRLAALEDAVTRLGPGSDGT